MVCGQSGPGSRRIWTQTSPMLLDESDDEEVEQNREEIVYAHGSGHKRRREGEEVDADQSGETEDELDMMADDEQCKRQCGEEESSNPLSPATPSSPEPSSLSEAPSQASRLPQEPNLDDATTYVTEVKREVSKQTFRKFTNLLQAAKDGRVALSDAVEQVERLFQNHQDLIPKFNFFLPAAHKIKQSPSNPTEEECQQIPKANKRRRHNCSKKHAGSCTWAAAQAECSLASSDGQPASSMFGVPTYGGWQPAPCSKGSSCFLAPHEALQVTNQGAWTANKVRSPYH